MDRVKYTDFFNEVIYPFVCEFESIDKNYFNKDKCTALRYNKIAKKTIYHFYEKKRKEIRSVFMNLENRPMDRHKIGAVMMYAVLRSNLFFVNRLVPHLPHKILMANEFIAINIGLNIVEMYRCDDCVRADQEKSGDMSIKSASIEQSRYEIKIPVTYHDANLLSEDSQVSSYEYINNICKALYYIKNKKNFDIFAYSNILFLLEKYTDDIKKLQESTVD